MLRQRIITALILLPLVITALFFVHLDFFAAVVVVLVYLMALEWAKLSGVKVAVLGSGYALCISLLNIGLWFVSNDIAFWPSPSWPLRLIWDPAMVVLAVSVGAIVVTVFIVLLYSVVAKWWANFVIRGLLGFALLPAFFVTLISVRNIGYFESDYVGAKFLLLMFVIIWAADTGAYFVGKYFGKKPLASNLSPNKTWEGAVGGVSLSVVIAWIASLILSIPLQSLFAYLAVVAGLAALSVFGDLFESALKREAGYKDSGNLLPGHGGLLDRLDSSIVVAPIYFLTFSYLGWFR